MSYLVFARKWRPQNFEEVVGQEHIATTLKNAISLDRVAHAYLFTGPRGIGKTSTARIFAKALNCAQGPTPSPCNACDSCREITEGRSLDVIEIDGASNRGIEQVRQLRENVKFAPAKSRFKVYIIDEVHQITTDGFNALLKTLEEPPPHVKFVFATTEAHKVLPTILSRCQRFDFRPLSVSAIAQKLKHISEVEKLDAAEEALISIARAAAGSMRDAESILDQLGSFCNGQISLAEVSSMLGMVGFEALWELAQKLIERRTPEALALVEQVINEGKDLTQFIAGLTEHFRNILITKILDEHKAAGLIDLSADYVERIFRQGKDITIEELFYIFDVLTRTQEGLRRALSGRVTVEMAVIRLTRRENLLALDEILARLNRLQQDLKDAPGSERGHPAVSESNPGKDEPAPIREEPQPAPKPPEEAPQPQKSPETLSASWPELLQAIREEKVSLASYLEFGRMSGLAGRVLTIAFPAKFNFYKETLEHSENNKFVEAKAQEVFRQPVKVKYILEKDAPQDPSEGRVSSVEPEKEQPIVQSALKMFQGRIVKRTSG